MRKNRKRIGSQNDKKQIEKEWEMDRKRTNEGFFGVLVLLIIMQTLGKLF